MGVRAHVIPRMALYSMYIYKWRTCVAYDRLPVYRTMRCPKAAGRTRQHVQVKPRLKRRQMPSCSPGLFRAAIPSLLTASGDFPHRHLTFAKSFCRSSSLALPRPRACCFVSVLDHGRLVHPRHHAPPLPSISAGRPRPSWVPAQAPTPPSGSVCSLTCGSRRRESAAQLLTGCNVSRGSITRAHTSKPLVPLAG